MRADDQDVRSFRPSGIWGWPHWLRKPFLIAVYFPFWRTVNATRRAWIAVTRQAELVTVEELWRITEPLDEHPEGWEHPCMCATCRSYCDG